MAKIDTTVTHTLTLTTDELKAVRNAARIAQATREGTEQERAVWKILVGLFTVEEDAAKALFRTTGK